MNANNWPLDEMAHEVYVVPYSIDECEQWLEGLNQPPPRFYWSLFENAYACRTKVIRLVKHNPANPDEMYCIQRVKKRQPRALLDYHRPSQYVQAEMNVALRPNAAITQVILYLPRHMTKAQKRDITAMFYFVPFGAIIFGLIISDFGGDIRVVIPVVVVFTVSQLIIFFGHYWQQRRMLFGQVIRALRLENHPKDNRP